MQDLNDLYYFVQVVDHRGFAPAARALGMQKSRLSRRIALLEEHLGVRLLQRSTRQFSVTEIGQEYYRQCLVVLAEAETAQAIIDNVQAEPKGILRMACPPGLLAYRFSGLIARYLTRHPQVSLQLKALNRHVDVIAEGYDVVIRTGLPAREPGMLVVRKLGEISQSLVASPRLVEAAAHVTSPAGLVHLPSLDFGLTQTEHPQHEHRWTLEHVGGRSATVAHSPRLISDDLLTLREAVLAGVGIAQLPSLLVEDDMMAGRLVHVLAGWRPRNDTVHAVFPSRRGLLLSLRALLDFLAEECEPHRRGSRPLPATLT